MFHSITRRAALPALLAAACLIAPPASAQPTFELDLQPAGPGGAPQTVAVVAVSSYQKVLDDVGYIGGLVGQPQAATMVEAMISMFTENKGLVGLDRDRPWCLLVQSSGQDFSPLVCLPVSDLDGLLALGGNAGVLVEEMGDDVKSLSMQGQTYFVKGNGQWAYAAQRADQLASLPADPTDSVDGLIDNYDIGVRLMAQNVPPMFKQLALDQLRQGMQEGLERKPDESNAEFEARQKVAQANIENIEQFIKDLDEAVVGIAINPDGGGLTLDFRGSAVAGTSLADQFSMYKEGGATKLSGFLQDDASVSVASAYTIPADVVPKIQAEYQRQMATSRAALEQLLDEADLPNEEVRDTFKSALEDVMACAEAMVASGEVDMVGNMQLKMGGASAIGGFRTTAPEKIESALKKVAALAEGDPNFPGINWNAETHEGVTLHTMSIPVGAPEAQDVFGKTLAIAVGIGPDAAYFSLGPDGVGALKAAITASGSGSAEVKPMQMDIALAQVMDFAAATAEASGEDAAVPQMIAQMLGQSDQSHIHVTVDGEANGLLYRVKVEEGVLQALGQFGAEMQRRQMGQ
ncbi:hypothetical protein KOR34_47970 [Posidoniimonas corsicana]|uniref:Uncharacterized protein n=1 Tax=Posidoniimonas corsicana TaxID=1938618 RepID=A0A5C5UWJ8_9BACT|nr:hypothetical protein [Posidoniimonas corsicana]TWT30239.1 hypothetical protein KOR34_47970 [Posidoniimonas corsicana]